MQLAGEGGRASDDRVKPPNKAMKLTRLSAAPGCSMNTGTDGGAASCARGRVGGRTASQLIAGVRRTGAQRTVELRESRAVGEWCHGEQLHRRIRAGWGVVDRLRRGTAWVQCAGAQSG